jgi:parallel beta-helix repeat protein
MNAITVQAEKVTIQGFTIQNSYRAGIAIHNGRTTVKDNILLNNGHEGIYISKIDANHNIITDNYFMNYGRGMLIYSWYNLISRNHIESSSHYGICVHGRGNDIMLNTFVNNEINALDYAYYENHWTSFSIQMSDLSKMIGNEWDDYTGTDADKDGRGDTPYISTSAYTAGIIVDIYPIVNSLRPLP